jgi:hypothetical protein
LHRIFHEQSIDIHLQNVQNVDWKAEGEIQFGRPGRTWEDDIKTELREQIFWIWIGSSWLRIGAGGGLL